MTSFNKNLNSTRPGETTSSALKQQFVSGTSNKMEEPLDTSINALLNMSCNKIETYLVDTNKPSVLPLLSKFSKADSLETKKPSTSWGEGIKNFKTSFDHEETPSVIMASVQVPQKNLPTEGFVTLKEQNMHLGDVDFWLIFDNSDINVNAEILVDTLRKQFESVNIMKVKQAYYLDRENEGLAKVTGWKLTDKATAEEIIRKSKEVILYLNNKKIKYEVISSTEELRKYLRKYELDQRLNQKNLFEGEYVKPLFKLHVQGLFFYEFDYVDICPENVCVICGVPPGVTNAQLKGYLQENEIPEPLNILRNPLEGETCVRLTFHKAADADLFRFKGLKIPIAGPFGHKPLVIMLMKNRGFDYFAQLINYQVMVEFEAGDENNIPQKINVLKEIQTKYGLISDINIVYSQLWVVTFVNFISARNCLDQAKFDQFSLKISVSKPPTSYSLTGHLFQSETSLVRNINTPQRPPPLLRVDPNQLCIKSEYFAKNPTLKRRYQKVYLRQEETMTNENNQTTQDFLNNDAFVFKDIQNPPPSTTPQNGQTMEEERKENKENKENTENKENKEERKVMVEEEEKILDDSFEDIPIRILPETLEKAANGRGNKKDKRKPAVTKKRTVKAEARKRSPVNRKRKLSNSSISDMSPSDITTTPGTKSATKNNLEEYKDSTPPKVNGKKSSTPQKMRAVKSVLKMREESPEKKTPPEKQTRKTRGQKTIEKVEKVEKKVKVEKKEVEKNNESEKKLVMNKQAQAKQLIQQNIEKIKNLIETHRDVRRRKTESDFCSNHEEIEIRIGREDTLGFNTSRKGSRKQR